MLVCGHKNKNCHRQKKERNVHQLLKFGTVVNKSNYHKTPRVSSRTARALQEPKHQNGGRHVQHGRLRQQHVRPEGHSQQCEQGRAGPAGGVPDRLFGEVSEVQIHQGAQARRLFVKQDRQIKGSTGCMLH